MTMLERVARAMSAVSEARAPGMLPYDDSPQYIRDQWMELARAAVEAMREPTEAVEDAGWSEALDDSHPVVIYQAMLDAILNEGKDSK